MPWAFTFGQRNTRSWRPISPSLFQVSFAKIIEAYLPLLSPPFTTPSTFWRGNITYRVDQQCCPGGNCPETPRRPSAGGLLIFGAKLLVIPTIYTKFKLMAHKFCINAWNYQWFSPKNPETSCRGSPGGLRTISAGTTLLGHTVDTKLNFKVHPFFV